MNSEQEHLLNCLARWMLNHWPSRDDRRACLERMWQRKAAPKDGKGNYENAAQADRFIEDLKRRMLIEWEKQKESA